SYIDTLYQTTCSRTSHAHPYTTLPHSSSTLFPYTTLFRSPRLSRLRATEPSWASTRKPETASSLPLRSLRKGSSCTNASVPMAVSSRLQSVNTISEEPMLRPGMKRSRRNPESRASTKVRGRLGSRPRGGGGCHPRGRGYPERICYRPVCQSSSEAHAFERAIIAQSCHVSPARAEQCEPGADRFAIWPIG